MSLPALATNLEQLHKRLDKIGSDLATLAGYLGAPPPDEPVKTNEVAPFGAINGLHEQVFQISNTVDALDKFTKGVSTIIMGSSDVAKIGDHHFG